MVGKAEFAEVIAYLEGAIGKAIADSDGERLARMRIYYDLLADLPIAALQVAVKRVALVHKYPSFPSVAEIREFAFEAALGVIVPISPAEAWAMAMRACNRVDVDVQGSRERHLDVLPPIVLAAIHAFGFRSLYNLPNSHVEAARAQFFKVFEQIAARERQTGLLPASVVEQIEGMGAGRLEGPAQETVKLLEKSWSYRDGLPK